MSIVEEVHTMAPNAVEESGTASLSTFDPARYRAEVDQFDITDDQKQELLLTLWSIMRIFVELGFEADVCAMVFPNARAIPGTDELGYDDTPTKTERR